MQPEAGAEFRPVQGSGTSRHTLRVRKGSVPPNIPLVPAKKRLQSCAWSSGWPHASQQAAGVQGVPVASCRLDPCQTPFSTALKLQTKGNHWSATLRVFGSCLDRSCLAGQSGFFSCIPRWWSCRVCSESTHAWSYCSIRLALDPVACAPNPKMKEPQTSCNFVHMLVSS